MVSEQLLSGWQRISAVDQLHLLVRSDQSISVPDDVIVHRVQFTRGELGSRLSAQSWELPRLCRSVRPDVLLGLLPTTALTPLPCRRVVIAWDFRDRLIPQQFGRKTLIRRRVSYAVGFRQTDGVVCISERTKRDALAFHPYLSKVPVHVAHLGADHVDSWPRPPKADSYAIAFGHFSNKNVDLVLMAWSAMQGRFGGSAVSLRLVGIAAADRPRLLRRVTELGLADVVTVSPWLSDAEYREQFAASSLVVFPSDFEGFGLPAVEAMRLGIPVVITPEPALLEVTDGHATVMEGVEPDSLARAVEKALQTPARDLDAAQNDADRFTWANFASGVRGVLNEVVKA